MSDKRKTTRIWFVRAVVKILFSLVLVIPCLGFTRPFLLINVKGHYSVEHTEISKEASGWVCKTEISPYHFSSVQPFSDASLSNLKRTSVSALVPGTLACRDFVQVEERSAHIKMKYSGCADQTFFKTFLHEVNRHCGRI